MHPWQPETGPGNSAPVAAGVIAREQPLVRRRPVESTGCSGRRQTGALILAGLALVVLFRVRLLTEPLWVVLAEAISGVVLAALCWKVLPATRSGSGLAGSGGGAMARVAWALGGLWLLWPLLANYLQRRWGYGAPPELLSIAVLGQISVLLALVPANRRTTALSVVASGFLVLLTVFVADRSSEVWIGMTWVVFCLWWLVANHWERMITAQARTVERSVWLRPLSVAAGLLLILGGSLVASGRIRETLLGRWEWMPTSGGTSWQDPTATKGVGDGDLIQAARDHAASFGAVDSDVFIESQTPSLFDVMSETLGDPVVRKRTERAMSLESDRLLSPKERPAESRSASQSFATARHSPRQADRPRDLDGVALMRWIGPRGIRLATHHYTDFDGSEWQEVAGTPLRPAYPDTLTAGDETWFCRPGESTRIVAGESQEPFIGTISSALKFLRFRSPRVPVPAGLELWHLPDVDREDFFSISTDGCLVMEGRQYVPDYTILHMVHREISEEQLRERAAAAGCQHVREGLPGTAGVQRARELAREWTRGMAPGWEQVTVVIERLRRDFRFARSSTGPLGEQGDYRGDPDDTLEGFLNERVGSDVMFATAAAIMLRELGFETRFATGFYVDPERSQLVSGETPILAEDVHAWAEVRVSSAGWIPLEPTPGYALPRYRQSLWTRFVAWLPWLGLLAAGSGLAGWGLWSIRGWIFEAVVRLATPLLDWQSPRGRMRWLVWVLDWRARLAGEARPVHIAPAVFFRSRIGLGTDHQADPSVQQLFSAADRYCYSRNEREWSLEADRCLRKIWSQGRIRRRELRAGAEPLSAA